MLMDAVLQLVLGIFKFRQFLITGKKLQEALKNKSLNSFCASAKFYMH
jgi:hypothetical protein